VKPASKSSLQAWCAVAIVIGGTVMLKFWSASGLRTLAFLAAIGTGVYLTLRSIKTRR
jgi:hypothetical protein